MTRSVSRVKPRNTNAKSLHMLRQIAPAHKSQKPGTYNRRIIIDARFGSYDYIFHATKGWRRRKRHGDSA